MSSHKLTILVGSLLLSLPLSSQGVDSDGLSLIVEQRGSSIHVFIVNVGSSVARVNTRFATGRAQSSAELVFEITDSTGKHYNYRPKPQYGPIDERYIAQLRPSDFVGRRITMERLKRKYGLIPGEYTMRATYRNHYADSGGMYTRHLVSDPISIVVD